MTQLLKISNLLNSWIQKPPFAWLAISLIILSGFFLDLGGRSFTSTDEGRFAEIGREIAVSSNYQDWIIQKLNGEIYNHKPPLFPAFIGLSFKVFNQFNEFSALFPSALFASLTLIICFIFWRHLFGIALALISTLILGTTYKFLDQARAVQVDMLMSFFITTALFCAYLYLNKKKVEKRWIILYFISCAFATLTKGPIGLLLPSLVVFVFIFLTKKWKSLFSFNLILGLFFYILIIGGWILFLTTHAPANYLYELFIRQNVTRYIDAFDHHESWFYYFPALCKDFLPWILLLPFLFLSKKFKENKTNESLSFFWVWFLTVFIFFSLSESKRGLYLLPLYAPLCLLIGNGIKNQGAKWLPLLFSYFLCFIFICPIAFDRYFDHQEAKNLYPKKTFRQIEQIVKEAPLKAYLSMKPNMLFYLQRTIPNFLEKRKVEQFFSTKERVYLILNKEEEENLLKGKNWPIVHTFKVKRDDYLLISNRD